MHTLRTREASSWSLLSSDDATRWPPSLIAISTARGLDEAVVESVCGVLCEAARSLGFARRSLKESLVGDGGTAPESLQTRNTLDRSMEGKGKPDEEEEGEGEQEEPRTLVVRARDGDWIMGDDLVLVVTGEETIVEIQEVNIVTFFWEKMQTTKRYEIDLIIHTNGSMQHHAIMSRRCCLLPVYIKPSELHSSPVSHRGHGSFHISRLLATNLQKQNSELQ